MTTNRAQRRELVAFTRKQRASWPRHLEPVPASEWPERRGRTDAEYPTAVWRSRDYLVQMYPEPPLAGVEVRRLSVVRVVLGLDGRWEQGLSWDDLMRCKRESGHGDWYAVEIYPRDRDVVNMANMRHLWCLAAPLPLGWFSKG